MLGRTYDGQACSVARALEVVGERWTLLIVRDALQGITKFDDFLTGLGVSRNVLAARLSRLVDDGILERVRYLEHPPRYEYVITARGRDLAPVVVSLMHWGDTYLAGAGGPPRGIEHSGCGGHVRPSMICSSCGDEVKPGEVKVMPATRGLPDCFPLRVGRRGRWHGSRARPCGQEQHRKQYPGGRHAAGDQAAALQAVRESVLRGGRQGARLCRQTEVAESTRVWDEPLEWPTCEGSGQPATNEEVSRAVAGHTGLG